MSNFSDNIVNKRFRLVFDYLMENGKIKSKSDIANHLDTYNHIINSILKGKRNITLKQMNLLIDIFGINANFLFGSSNQMLTDDEATFDIGESHSDQRKNITLMPKAAMAGDTIDSGHPEYEEFKKFSIPTLENDGELIAVEISGDSMMPNITNGDIVICEPVERGFDNGLSNIKNNSVYIVVSNSVVAKRVQTIRENNQIVQLRLISDNDTYPPYTLDVEEVQKLYKVKYRLTNYGIA